MMRFGYKQSRTDHTMFVKSGNDNIIILIVYVDNIVVTKNNKKEMVNRKAKLTNEFQIKDLTPANIFLYYKKYSIGIEVARSSNGIFLSQH